MMETSYLAAAFALIWLALYYLPIGGAFFRLALPLPLALLQLRRGFKAGYEGLLLAVMLLVVLMGPVRGPLVLFPYGFLALWLGWCWHKGCNWWFSWWIGVVIGSTGFLVRVLMLSLLVGENLWVVIIRAGSGLLDRLFDFLNLGITPELNQVQLAAIGLVVVQEIIYVLVLHALAFWLFPRLRSPIPDPPGILQGLVALDPL
ncbi:DUF2232 domain-containing protein [Prochlorococcus sp. MIT 1300]|uniref:DUF2232 domain-containing protein n=1 Tax=Prochlorococcus sp. MIT 1300 TaxID=3096218 RepID=UPI002A7534EC|nr:DUF2232 domain-containing protein [Prochlorococcus sp. MIT 1300]